MTNHIPPITRCLMASMTLCCLLITTLITGCGGGATGSPTTSESKTEDDLAPSAKKTDPGSATAKTGESFITEKDGRKWIGDVPLDIWYDDPLAVAGNSNTVATNTQANTTPDPGGTDPMPAEVKPEPAAGGKTDWKTIITAKAIDSEVTKIRNRFNADLQNVGSYNRSYLALAPHAATLTVLAGIAADHPDDIRWKKNARIIMDIAGDMHKEKLRSGAASFRPLKERFQNILDTLNGTVPPGIKPPADDVTLDDKADFGQIMQRFKVAREYLTVNGGTKESMEKNAEDLEQEAMVLTALGNVMNWEGFNYGDDDAFTAYMKAHVDNGKKMAEAVRNKEFDKFELTISAMGRACDECHGDYR